MLAKCYLEQKTVTMPANVEAACCSDCSIPFVAPNFEATVDKGTWNLLDVGLFKKDKHFSTN